jgi:carboxypeptidase C (cathepsin A)
VGFSFGYGAQVKSSVEAANDFVTFYQGWLKLFPEFVGRELIIAGESYGGHYIPAWANAILDFNAKASSSTPKINFAGAVIGNGCVNNTVQNTDEYVKFLHNENLIPASSNPRTQLQAQSAMVQHIGYTPNYYDYRVQSISCGACYGYNYTAWGSWFLQPEVEQSLNVCGDAGRDAFAGNAGGCISMGTFDSNDKFDYSGALGRTLDAGIPVTLFYGKTDTACNYVGGLAMANTIAWSGTKAFSSAPLTAMEIAGVPAGQTKSYGGLTWMQV